MTTWAERAEAREEFERDMSQWHLDHAQEENDMPRSYPVRLTQMSENQKMNRIIDLENALQQTNERIAAAVAEAVKAEREANCAAMCQNCAAGLKAVEGDQTTWNGRFVHWLPDEQRYVGCGAHAIRSRGGKQSDDETISDELHKLLGRR